MEKLECIVRAMNDKLATNIVAIDMRETSPLFDYFVLCTGSNQRLLNAIKDNVEEQCELNGYEVKAIEGLRNSQWILMDLGDIVVHIFEGEARDNYNLEKLWGDMPRVDISEYLK
ncbi:ribosome silencing factor [Sharpea azabuensis]|uniref:Ribosomal silencing factor RsfS n=2 Tax=Sharpea azabuensis TaxID=322505 RepID=A0A1H6Q1T4_9FIRM|nr:ribosome silencing factor [Sharpea azabuensis]HAJ16200.1 ribosome silencing factor [Erysipelotrichaceae bacterium]MEE3307669.1 ribosome silencing factor [Sharpea azabuensis]SEI37798.1 ribosome-associated protein [Sharpea azabuensis]SFD44931.1 ribosome-associated protein [Sharpea azabuensis]SFK47434.1 ribosome-associated protein [Sharpea azabuensis]